MDKPLKVFLSYASSEKDLAKDLASRLTAEGFEVWLFDREVLFGENYAQKVGKALAQSRAMVVFVSPEAVQSRSVTHEIGFAIGSLNYEHRLIPVVVRPTPDIPWVLKKMETVTVGDDWDKACRRICDLLQNAVTVV
jgi:hypothetical protein